MFLDYPHTIVLVSVVTAKYSWIPLFWEKRFNWKWQEAKGFRICLLGKDWIVYIASSHQIQNEAQFGEDLSFVTSRIPQDDLRIGLLGDRADWLWKHLVAFFPERYQMLDYFHCAEHIHKMAELQYGEKSQKCLQWVESTLIRLFARKWIM